ncbi:MAG: putative Ig domain-containing protein [Planctomycetota bacterium]|nr:putative Ig domain-containing protein [Planctomycetota bacterium]
MSNSAASTGILSYGTLTMSAGKTLTMSALPSVITVINGTTAQTQYSQLKVVGNLSIAGKSLNLSGSYTPAGGDIFTIASATNLTGTFTGLAEGSTITLNGINLTVNYTATSVTLTAPSSSSAPSITTQPTNTGVEAGQTATFTASATGNPAPTVQWQSSPDGSTGWADIGGATSPTLSFTASVGDNGKYYRAVFSNTVSPDATTNSAKLAVGVAPIITTVNEMTIPVGMTSGMTVIATGSPTPTYSIASGALPAGVTLDSTTGLFMGTPAAGTAGSWPVTIKAENGIGAGATQAFSLNVTSTITSFTVSKGVAQRSYIRYLDLGMDSNASALALLNNPSRVKLTKADLNGVGSAPVPLAGFLSVTTGQSTLAINFGTIGLGNSRNTTTADGYYTLSVDLDGNGSFETNLFFFRLFGDTNGDKEVTAADQSAVLAGCTAAYSANLDINGDGVVNSSDLNYVKKSVGRKLKSTLIVTS